MSRRRALLINLAVNSSPKPYDVRIIDSLQVHQADTTTKFTTWYVGKSYAVDTDNSLFTLPNGNLFPLRYANATDFNIQMAGKYCILNAISGNTMYYLPSGCTASYSYDASTGLYTITAHGQIQVFTLTVSN